jgi:hypothetical protein
MLIIFLLEKIKRDPVLSGSLAHADPWTYSIEHGYRPAGSFVLHPNPGWFREGSLQPDNR